MAQLTNPYQRRGRWFKGAFHFHTTNSDGAISPHAAVARYAAKNYRVIGISDHDFVSQVPADAFPGILLLSTAEVAWPHLLRIGTRAIGRLQQESFRRTIARCKREDSFSVLCHPAWSNCNFRDLERSAGVNAIEVYNHGCEIENAQGQATERWDMLLQRNVRLWGFATDDSHFSRTYPYYNGGWVQIRARALTRQSIIEALRTGSFYSSSGPSLFDLRTTRGRISLRSSPVTELRAIADGVGSGQVFFSRRPRSAWSIDYSGWGNQPRRYLRIELKDSRGHTLWTNPLYVKK